MPEQHLENLNSQNSMGSQYDAVSGSQSYNSSIVGDYRFAFQDVSSVKHESKGPSLDNSGTLASDGQDRGPCK